MEVYYIEPFTNTDQRFGGIGFRPTREAKELIKEYEKPVGQEINQQVINYFNIGKDDVLEVVGNIFERFYTSDLTKEDYIKACRIAKNLFLGENKDEN